jgi:hypothetical protein
MIRNERNIKISNNLQNITERYLNHIRENKMFPYIEEGAGYSGGAKIDSDSDVEEVVVRGKAKGDEPKEYWENLVGNGKYKKSLVSNVSKEIRSHKPNMKAVIKHLQNIQKDEGLKGGSVADFLKNLLSKLSVVPKSATSLGKSVVKTFADPQNLDKHDFANVVSLGAHEGLNPEKVKRARESAQRTKEAMNPPKKGYGKKKGGSLFDVLGDMLGLGKGAKSYKKGGATIKQSELTPTDQLPGSTMSGMGKSYKDVIAEVRKKDKMKGKPLKDILKYIKANNLYKK